MRDQYAVILLVVLLSSCSTTRQKEASPHLPGRAYREKSAATLEVFFEKWEAESTPANANRLSQRQRALYQVYRRFYRQSLEKQRVKRRGQEDCREAKYFVAPSRLPYSIFDSLHAGTLQEIRRKNLQHVQLQEDTLVSFWPDLSFMAKRVLYLFPAYRKTLVDFLGASYEGEGEERGKEAWRKRRAFLCSMIAIRRGNLGMWDLASHPSVNDILLEKDLDRAKVIFTAASRRGYAIFDRKKEKWAMIERRVNASE